MTKNSNLLLFMIFLFIPRLLIAKVPSIVFVGITEHFPEGYEAYNPLYGMPFIESSFLQNLRITDGYYAHVLDTESKRVYGKDLPQDGVSRLVKYFFHPLTGSLEARFITS